MSKLGLCRDSNQLNYVPTARINDLRQIHANKAFARFAYSALVA